jgi:hypothetical protein
MQDQTKEPLDLSVPEDGSIPAFLRREVTSNSEKEVPTMKTQDDEPIEDVADEEPAPPAPKPAKPAKKAPAAKTPRNATAKANGKGNGKAAVKAAGKASAKPAAKAAPAKGKAKAKVERQRDLTKLDQFGFRKGSIRSQAAAMYAKGKGATLAEVKEALGSVQFNLLTELTEQGYTIDKSEAKGATGRGVTRYKLHAKE